MARKDNIMQQRTMIWQARAIIALLGLLLVAGIGSTAAANGSHAELQRKIADLSLVNQQLADRMQEAEAALEALLTQQNGLVAEVHLLIRSLQIKSFEDAQQNPRLRNDLELLRTMGAFRREFEAKIRFYQTGRNRLTYLRQLAEDDTRMVATLSDFQIDALTTQVSLVINQYLNDAHNIQIDPQKIEMASARSVWQSVANGQ